jgi:hypothetical protein
MLIYRVFVLDEHGQPKVSATVSASNEDDALRQAKALCGPYARVELWVGPVRVANEACYH